METAFTWLLWALVAWFSLPVIALVACGIFMALCHIVIWGCDLVTWAKRTGK